MAFGHFLLGSRDFKVTALGLCVKWPSMSPTLNVNLTLYVIPCKKFGS